MDSRIGVALPIVRNVDPGNWAESTLHGRLAGFEVCTGFAVCFHEGLNYLPFTGAGYELGITFLVEACQTLL